jgi:hypothetical protein
MQAFRQQEPLCGTIGRAKKFSKSTGNRFPTFFFSRNRRTANFMTLHAFSSANYYL